MKFSTLAVALFASTTLVSVTSKKEKKSKKLTATFEFDDLEATVQVIQNKSLKKNNAAVWKVEINEFNKKLCPSGKLNWHVHQYPVLSPGDGIRDVNAALGTSAPACGGDVTGGHYDPTFACGGASQNRNNDVCDILFETDQTPAGTGKVDTDDYKTTCAKNNQSSCEIGDQSGKLGPLKATRKKQQFNDNWMTPIGALDGRSLVLHCCYDNDGTESCSPRLACANLE